ncbi:hypothetical protein JMUB3935_1630 [Leptotrichia trevisanii]|uniref:Uncharacterized protein n=1 Tax=Leptotrichia trevisanii TaxID=109328 RepID=A0A510KPS2_9FUSO|nr:hypothetical protein [Leptotrichia trevisanii]BBM52651.1 hypothetical protein JMUB3935_1630 [Leptotrichia trevisanii]
MEELKKNDFEKYIQSFNDIYLNVLTKNLNIIVFILGVIVPLVFSFFSYWSLYKVYKSLGIEYLKNFIELLITILGNKNNLKLILGFFLYIIGVAIYMVVLIYIDYRTICKKIKEYPEIEADKEITKLKKHQIHKKFNKYLKLYCTKKLVQKYEIDKENFRLFLNELITRIDNLKSEKPTVKAIFIIGIYKFFKSKLVILIISYLFGLFGEKLYESNFKILYYIILFYFGIIILFLIYNFFSSKNKNIDIEIERRFILMDILIEIFINSTINETIWITEEAEKKITDNKGYFFTKPREKPVSITEDNDKFFLIEDESNPKNIKLKKIKIEKIKFKQ